MSRPSGSMYTVFLPPPTATEISFEGLKPRPRGAGPLPEIPLTAVNSCPLMWRRWKWQPNAYLGDDNREMTEKGGQARWVERTREAELVQPTKKARVSQAEGSSGKEQRHTQEAAPHGGAARPTADRQPAAPARSSPLRTKSTCEPSQNVPQEILAVKRKAAGPWNGQEALVETPSVSRSSRRISAKVAAESKSPSQSQSHYNGPRRSMRVQGSRPESEYQPAGVNVDETYLSSLEAETQHEASRKVRPAFPVIRDFHQFRPLSDVLTKGAVAAEENRRLKWGDRENVLCCVLHVEGPTRRIPKRPRADYKEAWYSTWTVAAPGPRKEDGTVEPITCKVRMRDRIALESAGRALPGDVVLLWETLPKMGPAPEGPYLDIPPEGGYWPCTPDVAYRTRPRHNEDGERIRDDDFLRPSLGLKRSDAATRAVADMVEFYRQWYGSDDFEGPEQDVDAPPAEPAARL